MRRLKIALLANPESGAGEAAIIERLLRDRGCEVEAFGLERSGAAAASTPDRIVVAGGDGSIASAADAAATAAVPLAVVPVGTANDFARALDLPQDIDAAAALAVRGTRTRRLDLGRIVGGRPFVNAVSAGLSPLAAREARGLKRALGPLAYLWGGLRAGLTAAPVQCQVRCDEASLFAGRAWQITVGLTGAFGGGAELDADPRDGALDVAVVEARSRLRLIAHGLGMRAGRLEQQRGVIAKRCERVEVAIDGGGGFNVDGEIFSREALALAIEPQAFELVIG